MKHIILFAAVMLLSLSAGAKKKEKTTVAGYNYELSLSKENASSASGYKVFKVWSYASKREMLTQEICMRNAVHGILFKGLAGPDSGTQGNLPALCPEGYDAHQEYFDGFFQSGDFKQFIQLTSKGAQQAGDVVKTANKEWKVGLLVQVNVNALRKRLEADGLLQGARGIFSR